MEIAAPLAFRFGLQVACVVIVGSVFVMSAAAFSLPIAPKFAIAKFLVDMRLLAERSWRHWSRVAADALSEHGLSARERRAILDLQPAEDCYFAALVALHAYRIREVFPFAASEALLRELALQVDGAVGRSDNLISSQVFVTFGNIRRARVANNHCDHDQVIAQLLERLGVAKNPRTRPIMTNLAVRHRLAEPLALAAPNWWEAFIGIYVIGTEALREQTDRPGGKTSLRHAGPRSVFALRALPRRPAAGTTTTNAKPKDQPFSLFSWITRPPEQSRDDTF